MINEKNDDSRSDYQELHELIDNIQPEYLCYAKEALLHVMVGKVYEPNTILIPEFGKVAINKHSILNGELDGYVVFQKNKVL